MTEYVICFIALVTLFISGIRAIFLTETDSDFEVTVKKIVPAIGLIAATVILFCHLMEDMSSVRVTTSGRRSPTQIVLEIDKARAVWQEKAIAERSALEQQKVEIEKALEANSKAIQK